MFSLQFPPRQFQTLINAYWEQVDEYLADLEREIEEEIAPKAIKRGYYTKCDGSQIVRWKNGGNFNQIWWCKNDDAYVQEATRKALAENTLDEERLIALRSNRNKESPTGLIGVQLPTASVFLHFAFQHRYPILDVNACCALGVKVRHSVRFWLDYAAACRRISKEYELSMRDLDRALWYWGRNQRRQRRRSCCLRAQRRMACFS